MKRLISIGILFPLFAASLFTTGCASTQMKGTPFYTGEYAGPRGPAEDRVNIWPLLYYRSPALSVLWPLIDVSDEHLAVRPFMSIYGGDDEKKVYNVLWPIAKFDTRTGDKRVFPFFWGDGYMNLVPIYWHNNHPFGKDGVSDTLLPLWSYSRDARGYNLYLMGPLIRFKNRDDKKGWHVWPIAGRYSQPGRSYAFAFWPFWHGWSNDDAESGGNMLLPIYYSAHGHNSRTFLSLPYSHWRNDQGASWQLLFPLYYTERGTGMRKFGTLLGGYYRSHELKRWFVLPLLSGGRWSRKGGKAWILANLAGARWDDKSRSQHVFPLYRRWSDTRSSGLISPIVLAGKSQENGRTSRWHGVLPLYLSSSNGAEKSLLTLLGGYRRSRDSNSWLFLPFLGAGHRYKDSGSVWIIAPLIRYAWNDNARSHHLLPFYYWNGETRTFVSPFVARWMNRKGHATTSVLPLFSWINRDDNRTDLWLGGPLAHFSWGKNPGPMHVFPVAYWNTNTKTIISPILAKWQNGEKTTVVVPPALSVYSTQDGRSDLWAAGPLVHMSWGKNAKSSHVFPLLYRNKKTGTTVSPVLARWNHGAGKTTWVMPPVLSWLTTKDGRHDMWMLGPIAHFEWGKGDPTTQHVLPIFYRNGRTGTFVSPLIARWKYRGKQTWVCPPLLSWYRSERNSKELGLLAGLFREKWGSSGRSGHLFPLYMHAARKQFYTPIVGWNRSRDGFVYPLTPLVGVRTGDYAGGWLFPLFSHKRKRATGNYGGTFLWGKYWKRGRNSGSNIFPLYMYRNYGRIAEGEKAVEPRGLYGKQFYSLPICWYSNQLRITRRRQPGSSSRDPVRTYTKKHGCFPIWHYSKRRVPSKDTLNVSGSFLLMLYDYRRETKEISPKDTVHDYTRARILWRLWHYERTNGNVSVDIFPAITYDRKTDGFKKISFLWRFFRYERNASGEKQIDLLYIPLLRSRRSVTKDEIGVIHGESGAAVSG